MNTNVQAFAGIGWTLVVGEHVKDASDDGVEVKVCRANGSDLRLKTERRCIHYVIVTYPL